MASEKVVDQPVIDETEFYVSNRVLSEEYRSWYAACRLAQEEGIPEPEIPKFIVEAMIKIATRLTYKPNFINYTFKEDMVGDAIYDCVRFAKGFKEKYISKKDGLEKVGNPFSYLTTICFNAFLRRIEKEKTQRYIKASIVMNTPDEEFIESANGEDGHFVNTYIEFLREVGYDADLAPKQIKRAKKKEEKAPLLEFTVDE